MSCGFTQVPTHLSPRSWYNVATFCSFLWYILSLKTGTDRLLLVLDAKLLLLWQTGNSANTSVNRLSFFISNDSCYLHDHFCRISTNADFATMHYVCLSHLLSVWFGFSSWYFCLMTFLLTWYVVFVPTLQSKMKKSLKIPVMMIKSVLQHVVCVCVCAWRGGGSLFA